MQFRSHRYRTEFPTALSTPIGKLKIIIDDVNETGALISLQETLLRGHKVEMVVLNHRIAGIVQWSLRGKCGIAFRPHLSIAQVDTLRYKSGGLRNARHTSSGYAEMR